MGQASSRGTSDARQRQRHRDRIRPTSWAPSSLPPPPPPENDNDTVPDLRPAMSSSRPLSRFNPFTILPARSERPDAAPAAPAAPPAAAALARRRSRLTRARASLSLMPSLFHRRQSGGSRDAESPNTSLPASSFRVASSTPLRHPPSAPYDRSPFLPNLLVPDLDLNFEDLPTNTEAEIAHARLHSHLPRLNLTRRDGRSSALIPSLRPHRGLDQGIRSMTSSIRRRRSPLRRDEDQAAMLSRLLSVAAAATAASLMGDDHRAVSEARSVADDGEDGTFDSFLQALQNGRIASALRQSSSGVGDGAEIPSGSPAPLNFFRMFRFGSSTPSGARRSDARSRSRSSASGSPSSPAGEEEEGDGRMVPIIIVGIRSINPGTNPGQDDNIPPFLDALSSFPTPLASPSDGAVDGVLRQPQQRFSHRRRASMGGTNTLPSNYDNQRQSRAPERPRPWSSLADSPSGPLPPPSTPASSGLSAISSGTTTPALSTSPPSPTTPSQTPSRRGSFVRRPTGPGLEPTAEEPPAQPRIPRQRRMSESDFTRFGSGSARRNGVVEPDHNPGEGSRSWIIYVLGGSYPENHPILTTPSLFTDSPTYEDMLLLSSLLGPAKPPVASEEDVASAPGLVTIRNVSGTLVAEAVQGGETVALAADARCLVCLCDFEVDEEARKLVKCGHMFHRMCIDQVCYSLYLINWPSDTDSLR
jgi:hypothetical protein